MAKSKLTSVLTATEAKLETRFLRLAQTLNGELDLRDQRLSFDRVKDRSGVMRWQLADRTRTDAEERHLPRIAATLATAANESAVLEFGLSEQWNWRERAYEFKASNLSFAVSDTSPESPPILFRLEWAGRELSNDGVLVLPGRGSAHPHWQFDGDFRTAFTVSRGSMPVPEEPVLSIAISDDFEDLTAALEDAGPTQTTTAQDFSWFHRLHLPARAQWSEVECVMPDRAEAHQHEPKEFAQLDRWLISALRYLRHEFEAYAN